MVGTIKQNTWSDLSMASSLSVRGGDGMVDQNQLRRLSTLVDGFMRISMTGERRLQRQVAVVSTTGWSIFDCGRAMMSIAESHGKVFSPDVHQNSANHHA